jgi:hypothetical protein
MGAYQYEEELLETMQRLPAEQIREVIDFAAFLRHRLERQDTRLQAEKERAAQRMEARRNRVGPIGLRAADLVEEGRVTRVAAVLREGDRL